MSQKMIRVRELFFEYPEQVFSVRDIAAKTGISKSTAQRYLTELQQEGVVSPERRAAGTLRYRIKKTCHFIERIAESGLIEDLAEALNPSCIILFGSVRKGDSAIESDIDLFIESQMEKEFDFSIYEQRLGHPIQAFIEPDINTVQPRLRTNIVNGITLYGAFKLR